MDDKAPDYSGAFLFFSNIYTQAAAAGGQAPGLVDV